MEITYHREGDYLIPDLTIGEQKQVHLGKYGMMRLNYLKTQKKAEYSIMLIEGKLSEHLEDIDKTAKERVDRIVTAMAKQDGTDEELKAKDQLKWVGLMNNYFHCAEEIVLKDLVFD